MILASPITPLENLLRSLLDFFHNSVGLPWGWSIVALTILVRICLVPLVVRQIHSMQNMQAHAPQMKEIQRKYKGDRTKMNEELMKFYKENNINPASSCLPLLAQFPIFISLFYVLRKFAKQPAGRRPVVARRRPVDRRARPRPLVGLPAALHLRGEPDRVDVLHVGDDGQDAALDHDGAAGRLHPADRALPDRPRPLLDDDEPVDGRPGARDAEAGAEARPAAEGRRDAEEDVADTAEGERQAAGRREAGSARPAQQQQPSAPKVVRRKKQKRARR